MLNVQINDRVIFVRNLQRLEGVLYTKRRRYLITSTVGY